MKLKSENIKANFVRFFFSFIIAMYFVGAISDFYPDLETAIEILIGALVFLLINIAAKFIPIEDILTKL